MIQKPPFTPERLQEERDKDKSKVYTIRFNLKELDEIEEGAILLQQERLTTVVKQLVSLGLAVLQQPSTIKLLNTVLLNKVRNERIGIQKVEPKFKKL